jgi:hypothetical protein
MGIVDEELGDTRALENTTLDLLRAPIHQEVTNATSSVGTVSCTRCNNADTEKQRQLGLYDPHALSPLNFKLGDLHRRTTLRTAWF